MFDIGWSEMLLVAIVALIVVGPQDFPRLLRTVGQWVGRARSMMSQIQYAVNEAAAETDIDPSDWTRPNTNKSNTPSDNQIAAPTDPVLNNTQQTDGAASSDAPAAPATPNAKDGGNE